MDSLQMTLTYNLKIKDSPLQFHFFISKISAQCLEPNSVQYFFFWTGTFNPHSTNFGLCFPVLGVCGMLGVVFHSNSSFLNIASVTRQACPGQSGGQACSETMSTLLWQEVSKQCHGRHFNYHLFI